MKPLRRTTTPNAGSVLNLELDVICDECKKYRALGNHQRCSKLRQARNTKKREGRQ